MPWEFWVGAEPKSPELAAWVVGTNENTGACVTCVGFEPKSGGAGDVKVNAEFEGCPWLVLKMLPVPLSCDRPEPNLIPEGVGGASWLTMLLPAWFCVDVPSALNPSDAGCEVF